VTEVFIIETGTSAKGTVDVTKKKLDYHLLSIYHNPDTIIKIYAHVHFSVLCVCVCMYFPFFVILGFELGTSCLLDRSCYHLSQSASPIFPI
jgi:hypothetical protein